MNYKDKLRVIFESYEGLEDADDFKDADEFEDDGTCEWCEGSGVTGCHLCGGTGDSGNPHEGAFYPCYRCEGSGEISCVECGGEGIY